MVERRHHLLSILLSREVVGVGQIGLLVVNGAVNNRVIEVIHRAAHGKTHQARSGKRKKLSSHQAKLNLPSLEELLQEPRPRLRLRSLQL